MLFFFQESKHSIIPDAEENSFNTAETKIPITHLGQATPWGFASGTGTVLTL